MCDTIPGEVLVSFHRTDSAAAVLMERIQINRIPGVSVIENLEDRLASLHLRMRSDTTDFRFFRLEVEPHQEDYFMNHLQFIYRTTVLEAIDHHWMDFTTHSNVLYNPQYRHCHINCGIGDRGRAKQNRRQDPTSSPTLHRQLCSRYLVPDLESLCTVLPVGYRLQPVPARTEVISNGAMGREKALRMARRLEATHRAFPLSR